MDNQNKQNYGGFFGAIVPIQSYMGGFILSIFIGKPAWDNSIGWVRRSTANLVFLLLPFIDVRIHVLNFIPFGIGILTSIISLIFSNENEGIKSEEHQLGGIFGFIAKFQNLIGGIILQFFIGKPA